jgi:hypothetical protein
MARKSTSHQHDIVRAAQYEGNVIGRRELIMLARPEAGLALSPSGFRTRAGAPVASLTRLIEGIPGATIRPLFGSSEDRVRERTMSLRAPGPSPVLTAFYHVDAPDERLDELAASLRRLDEVAAAYVKPPGEPPQINDMAPS